MEINFSLDFRSISVDTLAALTLIGWQPCLNFVFDGRMAKEHQYITIERKNI